jgi:hypothetical protein
MQNIFQIKNKMVPQVITTLLLLLLTSHLQLLTAQNGFDNDLVFEDTKVPRIDIEINRDSFLDSGLGAILPVIRLKNHLKSNSIILAMKNFMACQT